MVNYFVFLCSFFQTLTYLVKLPIIITILESVIVLWKFKPDCGPDQRPDLLEDDESKNLEKWTCYCMLRGHLEDVYDISWSPDSTRLISGGVDNKAIIWDVVNGIKILLYNYLSMKNYK